MLQTAPLQSWLASAAGLGNLLGGSWCLVATGALVVIFISWQLVTAAGPAAAAATSSSAALPASADKGAEPTTDKSPPQALQIAVQAYCCGSPLCQHLAHGRKDRSHSDTAKDLDQIVTLPVTPASPSTADSSTAAAQTGSTSACAVHSPGKHSASQSSLRPLQPGNSSPQMYSPCSGFASLSSLRPAQQCSSPPRSPGVRRVVKVKVRACRSPLTELSCSSSSTHPPHAAAAAAGWVLATEQPSATSCEPAGRQVVSTVVGGDESPAATATIQVVGANKLGSSPMTVTDALDAGSPAAKAAAAVMLATDAGAAVLPTAAAKGSASVEIAAADAAWPRSTGDLQACKLPSADDAAAGDGEHNSAAGISPETATAAADSMHAALDDVAGAAGSAQVAAPVEVEADTDVQQTLAATAIASSSSSTGEKRGKGLRVTFAPLPPSKNVWLAQLRAMPPEGKARFLRRLQSVGRKAWCIWRRRCRGQQQQAPQQQQRLRPGLKRDWQQAATESSSEDEVWDLLCGSPLKKGHGNTHTVYLQASSGQRLARAQPMVVGW